MSSISKNIFSIYSSAFYQCIVVAGLIIVVFYIVWEICNGALHVRDAVTDIWVLATCLTYIAGRNNRHKYLIMWIVLFSQLMLALWIAE